MADRELNLKQLAFCREYVKDHNATQAAIRAGYSDRTANRIASHLLSKVDIQQEIANIHKPAIEESNKQAWDFVTHLTEFINSDPSEWLEETEQEVDKTTPDGITHTFVNKIFTPKPKYLKFFKMKIVHGKVSYEQLATEKLLEMLGKAQGIFWENKNVNLSLSEELQAAVLDLVDKLNG